MCQDRSSCLDAVGQITEVCELQFINDCIVYIFPFYGIIRISSWNFIKPTFIKFNIVQCRWLKVKLSLQTQEKFNQSVVLISIKEPIHVLHWNENNKISNKTLFNAKALRVKHAKQTSSRS